MTSSAASRIASSLCHGQLGGAAQMDTYVRRGNFGSDLGTRDSGLRSFNGAPVLCRFVEYYVGMAGAPSA